MFSSEYHNNDHLEREAAKQRAFEQDQQRLRNQQRRADNEVQEKIAKTMKPQEDFENSVIKGELPVDEVYKPSGKTLRQIINREIASKYPQMGDKYANTAEDRYLFKGRYALSKRVPIKRRLLLEGAKPKTTLSLYGRTLKYKSNAPFVNWNKWGKTIRDPRQTSNGEKKEFPPPTEENIEHLEETTVKTYWSDKSPYYLTPKGGRKTRKNRR